MARNLRSEFAANHAISAHAAQQIAAHLHAQRTVRAARSVRRARSAHPWRVWGADFAYWCALAAASALLVL